MDYFELLEKQKQMTDVLKKGVAELSRYNQVGTPYLKENIPKIIPAVDVREGSVKQVLEAIVENQKAQIEALQAQKEATEKELDEMKRQADDAVAEARSSKRFAVASIVIMVLSLLHQAWPTISSVVQQLSSAG